MTTTDARALDMVAIIQDAEREADILRKQADILMRRKANLGEFRAGFYGQFGVAVHLDPDAREWQALEAERRAIQERRRIAGMAALAVMEGE